MHVMDGPNFPRSYRVVHSNLAGIYMQGVATRGRRAFEGLLTCQSKDPEVSPF